jgi:hypothetical protein
MNYFEFSMQMLQELGRMHNSHVSPFVLSMYESELEKHGWDKVANALKQIFKSSKKFPTIAEIETEMGIIKPEARDESDHMAGEIIKAISKFGEYQAVKAKEHLGDLAWTAIERMGGWGALCMTDIDQLQTLRAQLRGMCQSVRAMDSVGRLHEPLPGINSSNLEQVNKMLALMGGGRKPDLEPLN